MKNERKGRLFHVFLLSFILFFIISSIEVFYLNAASSEFAGGSGTESDPYLIETKEHLNHVRDNPDAYYKMMNDIVFSEDDFAEGVWNPIGSANAPFDGFFDGNGYVIKNLHIVSESSTDLSVGLFGYFTGSVKNLGLQNYNVTATNTSPASHTYLGSIVEWCYSGTILNCYSDGILSVSSLGQVTGGGIVGVMQGSASQVQNCYFSGMLSVSSSGNVQAGGIVGSMSGISPCVTDSFNMGYVISDGSENSCTGGIVGKCFSGNVRNVYNVGAVTGISRGGIFGCLNQGTLDNGYYLSSIETSAGSGEDVGVKLSWDEMKSEDVFVGFDFNSLWKLSPTEEYPCPVLQNLTVPAWNFASNTTEFSGGTGVPWDPYLIETKDHLDHVRNDLDAHYKLLNDITFSEEDFSEQGAFYCAGAGWNPIGFSTMDAFSGSFDGNGHIIENLDLNIVESSFGCGGLFGYNAGSIRNLGLVNCSIMVTAGGSDAYAGGVCGWSSGEIKNCYFTGNVAGTSAGGIVGCLSSGTVVQCYNAGRVSGSREAGGVVGCLFMGTVCGSYNVGIVESAGSKIGALVGTSFGEVINCYYLESTLQGVGVGTDLSVKCTYDQMMQQSTFCDFDFENQWTMKGNSDYLYPELQSVKMQFEKRIDSIEILQKPGKLTYVEGELFDPSGMIIVYRYNNGQTEEINDYEICGYSDTPGIKIISVSKDGMTASFSVTVEQKVLVSIHVTTLPDKIVYVEGSAFDSAGMIVMAYYNNNTSEEISDYTVSGYTPTPGSKTITVLFGEKSTSFTVTVNVKSLDAIKVTKKPKSTYVEGEEFDSSGMTVKAYYNDGTSQTITDYTYSGYTSTPGTKTITVTFDGKTDTFPVSVEEKSLTSIQITKTPKKMIYLEGESFDPSGMVVTAYYNNGTSETVSDFTVRGFASNPGVKEITVSYQRKTARFSVTVNSKVLTSIAITKQPNKLTYFQGDSFNKAGMVVVAYYNNGTSYKITDYTIHGDLASVGRNTVTLSYGGKSATLTVTVNPKVPSVITSEKHTVSNKNISKIAVGTPINVFLAGLNEGVFCRVYIGSSEVSADKSIGTGMMVKIMDGTSIKKSYTAIVTGDVNGDGMVSVTDMISVKAYLLKKSVLTDVYYTAADVNGDGGISITDFIQMKAKILKKGNIIPR